MTPFPILVSSAGRRGALVQILRRSLAHLSLGGPILATDVSGYAAAFHLADRGIVVPPQSDPGFVDALLEICEREQVRLVVPTHDGELPLLAAARDRFADDRDDGLDLVARDDRDRPGQGADTRLADRARVSDRPPGNRRRRAGRGGGVAVAADREAALRLGRHRRRALRLGVRPAGGRRRRAGARARRRAHRRRARAARRPLPGGGAAAADRGPRRRGRQGRHRPARRPRVARPQHRGDAAGRLRRAQRAGLRGRRRAARDRGQRPVRRRLPARLRGGRASTRVDDRGDPRASVDASPTTGARAS